jgi:hypothetical protein
MAASLFLFAVGCSSDDVTGEPPATSPPPSTTPAETVPEMQPLPAFPAPDGPPCEAGSSGALVITPECVDPDIAGAPVVDTDEMRTAADPVTGITAEFRYINGGFSGSDVRFSFYFPSAATYGGRFFQSTYPTLSVEDVDPSTVVFAIENGAYVVSSNNAGGVAASPALGGYRANAAAAKFSRVVAAELYGAERATRGHIFGASGGAYQTLAAAENTIDVWQGSVPMVPGVPNSIPSFMSVQVLALRALADKWPAIVDAMEPGGSGDPYDALDEGERAILEEATRLGHPLGGWWQYETLRGGAFGLVTPAVLAIDAPYVDDFFSVSGYEGADDPAVAGLRVQFDATVAAVEGDPVTSLTLSDEPTGYLDFVDLVVLSGAAAGTTISLVEIDGTAVTLPESTDPDVVASLAQGDTVRIDNSFYVALSYYHRHQVPAPDQYGWDQFRGTDGTAVPAQRPVLVGQVLSQVFGGVATGDFHGKMIMLSSVLDVQAFPWAADWYRDRAEEVRGDDLDDAYRLWYVDNADHQPPTTTEGYAHIVLYDPVLQQALLDLDAWVLDGANPPAGTAYEVTDDNQVVLAATAEERGGIQSVVELRVAAGDECGRADTVRAEVMEGEPVVFDLTASMPPGTGDIIDVEWDFVSAGLFSDRSELDAIGPTVSLCRTHIYDDPGTYFAVARVTSQRDGQRGDGFRLIQNLARVRVVVD